MSLSTHVLDTTKGRPAKGVPVVLERLDGSAAKELARGTTDADGRIGHDVFGQGLAAGVYRLTFDTGSYFREEGVQGFYPYVPVVFRIADPAAHHHVPLLLSAYGFSTYRGS